jgi:4-amino-4-deoxy-L-arabinose transferase-like glycosyltransferase
MLYWVAAIGAWLGDRMTFVPIRTLAMLASLLVVTLTFGSALRAKRPLAGAIAVMGIVVSLLLEMPPDDGLAYNGELILDVFALGGLLCLTLGLAPERARPGIAWLAGAGALASLGALTKQVGAVTILGFALWTVAACVARCPKGNRWRPLWALLTGAALPVAVVLVRYAAAGALRTFFFYFVTYNSSYYMAPFKADAILHDYRGWMMSHAWLVLTGAALVVLGCARALTGPRTDGWWRAVDRRGFLLAVSVCAGLTGAVANATVRGFPHYFVQAIPWFALLFGLLLEEALGILDATPWKMALLHTGALAPLACVAGLMVSPKLDEYRLLKVTHDDKRPICRYINTHSNSDDHIYVWGFAPDIYTICKRVPASRYVYSTFQSGYVPFVDTPRDVEHARAVPGSPGLFLEDLEATHAPLVIDIPQTLAGRSMTETHAYAEYLKWKYCAPITYDGVQVYVRRANDGSCPGP